MFSSPELLSTLKVDIDAGFCDDFDRSNGCSVKNGLIIMISAVRVEAKDSNFFSNGTELCSGIGIRILSFSIMTQVQCLGLLRMCRLSHLLRLPHGYAAK